MVAVHLEGFHCVGYVKSAHGISGELFIQLFVPDAEWKSQIQALYLLPKNLRTTNDLKQFRKFSFKAHKTGLIFRTDQIHDRNVAETYKGASVYISEDSLKAQPGETIFLHQILSFDIVDKDAKVLGRITSFSTNGAQDLLVVKTLSGRDALVPLVEDFIVEVDFENRILKMDLPPGLLNLDELE